MKNWLTRFLEKVFKRHAGDGPDFYQAEPVREYEPNAGMRGKDVEWVPCSPVVMNRLFEMARVTSDDYLIDPGSGDGRIVIGAAKLGAQALGVEYNPRMVELSRKNAEKEGVSSRATFLEADFFEMDLSKATVIALFLRKDINIALRPKILEMRPGTRVVSNIFDMGEWQADEVLKIEDEDYYFKNHTAYFWIVPAKVGGVWNFPRGELTLVQNFQMLTGALKLGNTTAPVMGKMTGDRISFFASGSQYKGRVTGNRMEIEATEDGNAYWTATLSEQ
jgi:hypothetical protein